MTLHPAEQFASARRPSSPVVEIGKCIGTAEMVPLRTLRRAPVLFQQPNGTGQVALVSFRSGHHDSALDDQFCARRGLTQLFPQDVDIGPVAKRSVAVGEHWVLLGRAGERSKRLEVFDGVLPLSEAVEGEPHQLPPFWEFGRLFHDGTKLGASITEAFGLKGLRCLIEFAVERFGSRLAHQFAEGGRWLLHGVRTGRQPTALSGGGSGSSPPADGPLGGPLEISSVRSIPSSAGCSLVAVGLRRARTALPLLPPGDRLRIVVVHVAGTAPGNPTPLGRTG